MDLALRGCLRKAGVLQHTAILLFRVQMKIGKDAPNLQKDVLRGIAGQMNKAITYWRESKVIANLLLVSGSNIQRIEAEQSIKLADANIEVLDGLLALITPIQLTV